MTKAENIRNQCMKILDKYDADYRGVTVDRIDGTTYVIFKYYGGTNDTVDRNDDSWDEMFELDGVVDVGYGEGYGIEGKYEDSLLIELDEDIVESKKSARKSIKESSIRCVTFEQIVDSRFDDISKGEKILNDRKDEIIELCGDDFSVYTNKIEFLDWGDDESQYRQKYYIRKNNNNVNWNDLYKIVNSVKAVPYKFDKINDSVFESRKLIKESADDNWYKLKMLNEMLDAMEEDEYNIPKVGIYGVTKNINLDIGAIEALIKYYK